jgi:hypothetical protein
VPIVFHDANAAAAVRLEAARVDALAARVTRHEARRWVAGRRGTPARILTLRRAWASRLLAVVHVLPVVELQSGCARPPAETRSSRSRRAHAIRSARCPGAPATVSR